MTLKKILNLHTVVIWYHSLHFFFYARMFFVYFYSVFSASNSEYFISFSGRFNCLPNKCPWHSSCNANKERMLTGFDARIMLTLVPNLACSLQVSIRQSSRVGINSLRSFHFPSLVSNTAGKISLFPIHNCFKPFAFSWWEISWMKWNI